MKKLFSWLFLCFLACAFFSSFATCSEKSAEQWLSETDVCFEAKKLSDGICVIGKEAGKEVFRTNVNVTGTNFTGFTYHSSGNFHLELLENQLRFQYRSPDSEIFELRINETGDIEIPEEYSGVLLLESGFDRNKRFGFKTSGTFINKAPLAFYSLVVEANQIHNYGTIQAYTFQLFQNYLFNKRGCVIKVGERPTGTFSLLNLFKADEEPGSYPNFVHGKIDNQGTFLSKGKFQIKGGLDYCGNNGFFDELEMSGGGLTAIKGGRLTVRKNLSGRVSGINLEKEAFLDADNVMVDDVQDLRIDKDAVFHTSESLSLTVQHNYTNNGTLASCKNLSLELKEPLKVANTGSVCAGGRLTVKGVSTAHNTKSEMSEELQKYWVEHKDDDPNSNPELKRRIEQDFRNDGQYKHSETCLRGIGALVSPDINATMFITVIHRFTLTHEFYRNWVFEYSYTDPPKLIGKTRFALSIPYTANPAHLSRLQTVFQGCAQISQSIRTDLLGAISRRVTINSGIVKDCRQFFNGFYRGLSLAGATGSQVATLTKDIGYLAALETMAIWGTLHQHPDGEKWMTRFGLEELYEFCEDLLDPRLYDPNSWWARNVVRTSTLAVHPDTGLSDPFTPLAQKNPALLPLIAAIVSDKASMETLEIVAKLPSVADTQSIDYMLEFMSSGLDPPDDTSVLQKEAPKKPSSTPQPKQSDKTPAGSGGPDPERDPDPDHKAKGIYTYELARELAQRFKRHLNRLDGLRETIVYVIKDSKGKIMKYGETAAGCFKSEHMKHIYKRPYRQIVKASKKTGQRYRYEVVGKFKSKREARECETSRILNERKVDREACPWNKGLH